MHKNKLEEVEILRGIAFLAIIMQHTIAGMAFRQDISNLEVVSATSILAMIRFAVPAFVFITGMVLFYNSRKYNYKEFLYKRFKQIFVPYFIWTLIYYVWISILSGGNTFNIANESYKILGLTITGTACYHLWYMVMIFQFYIFIPIFKAMIKPTNSQNKNFLFVVITLVFNISVIYVYNHNMGFLQQHMGYFKFIINYFDRNLLCWVFYFVLGAVSGIYIEKWRSFVVRLQPVNIIVYIASFYIIFRKILNTALNNASKKYILCSYITAPLNISMVVFLISSLILTYFIAILISQKNSSLAKTLNVFGKYSFGGYLIHAFVLHYTDWATTTFLAWIGIIPQIFVSFTLCSILTLMLTCLISRLRFSDIIIGKVK